MSDEYNTCKVDPSKYVVLDVETNGLSSVRDDLLSISIYKPDTETFYNRFLPLELNSEVLTTHINGIKTEDLVGLLPLTQEEVDSVIDSFELSQRTILTYGSIDEKFITKYFERHHLRGAEQFAFYNFKHEVISSKFSEGNITKDNLCAIYGIENVQKVHSGSNDCLLEWELFKHMNGQRLLITDNKVFEFNEDYVVPASYITTYPNMKYYLPKLPSITCESRVVFSLPIAADKLKKFPTNFNGMILEHLINSMLQVKKIHSEFELRQNKMRLKYLGKLPSEVDVVPMVFNRDGTMTATRPQDKILAKDINSVVRELKDILSPLFSYIKNDIFRGEEVKSQELMMYPEKKVLAVCDLSNDYSTLEIKAASFASVHSYTEQLYYEANGRACYVLLTDWSEFPKQLVYRIHEVSFMVKEQVDPQVVRLNEAKAKIETAEIELRSYKDVKSPVELKCKKCGYIWKMSYHMAKKNKGCPNCIPKDVDQRPRVQKPILSELEKQYREEEKKRKKLCDFQKKVSERSGNQIMVLSFTDSRSSARGKCIRCGYEWETRADHLLDRPNCPCCKKDVEGQGTFESSLF